MNFFEEKDVDVKNEKELQQRSLSIEIFSRKKGRNGSRRYGTKKPIENNFDKQDIIANWRKDL